MEQEFDYREEKNESLIKVILQRYLPFWPLIILTTLFTLTIAYFYLRYTPKVYQSQGKILVKDDKKGVDESKVLEALDVFSEKKKIENEIEVLKSWPLIEEVVKKLNLYTVITSKGNLVDTEFYNPDAPVNFIALQPENIKENTKLIPFKIDFKNNEITINKSIYKDGQILKIGDNNFKIILNKKKNQVDDEQYFFSINTLNQVAKSIISGLQIQSTTDQSTLITVTLKSNHPKNSQDIINTLFEEYQKSSLKDKNLVASNTLTFIDKRLELVSKELDSVENDIENYKKTTGIINLSEQSGLYLERFKNTDEELNKLNTQLALLKDIEKYIDNRGINPGTVPSLLGINDVTLMGLLTKLYDTELLYNRQLKVSGSKSDIILQLKGDLSSLRNDILVSLRNIRKSLLTSKEKVEVELLNSQRLISEVPQKEKELLQISRQLAIKNNLYSFLLQKKEETAISFKSSVTNSRLIEPALFNSNPISPIIRNIWLIALGGGVVFFVFIVFLIEQANTKVLFRKEIEKRTKIPIIGELIESRTGKSVILVRHGSRSLIAEQFKIIRTNLSFYGLKSKAKTILVTSSISGEGKSFICINIATSYALLGKKVALLELDLRKPKIAKQLGINSKYGITHYLTDNAAIEQISNPWSEYPNLCVFPSGIIPPNPSELISSEKFELLIADLKERFDYVIMDSPPIGLVTDAQLLGGFCDSTIYILRHNFSPQVALEMVDSLYKQAKLPNLTLIFNGIKARGINLYSKYGYGSGYGYGATYGSPYNNSYYINHQASKSVFKSLVKSLNNIFFK